MRWNLTEGIRYLPTRCEYEETRLSTSTRARWNLAKRSQMPMTAENIDRAHAITILARRKNFWKIFRSESFETSNIWFSLKIASVQDYWQRWSAGKVHLSWFTLHEHWLFLCVSLACVFVWLFSLKRVENELWCASWCDAPFRTSHLSPFLPRQCGLIFLRAALCLLHRHCMDRSARRQPTLSDLQLANLFMALKTNLYSN